MQTIIKRLLGNDPWTSFIGYLALVASVVYNYMIQGETDWKMIAFGVIMALFGRTAGDAKKQKPE